MMDVWTYNGPYLALVLALLAVATMLRDAVYKIAEKNRAAMVFAGLGHALAVVAMLGFTLLAFYEWISQYRDGVKTGNQLVVSTVGTSGSLFAIAFALWALDAFLRCRTRKRDSVETEQSVQGLRSCMTWYIVPSVDSSVSDRQQEIPRVPTRVH
ncbi:hypothetical protein [Rhodococcus opacus]|nr:hypothetical protein [Rhodococcus opacus]